MFEVYASDLKIERPFSWQVSQKRLWSQALEHDCKAGDQHSKKEVSGKYMGGKKKPNRPCELIKETAKSECGKDGIGEELRDICDDGPSDQEIYMKCSQDEENK